MNYEIKIPSDLKDQHAREFYFEQVNSLYNSFSVSDNGGLIPLVKDIETPQIQTRLAEIRYQAQKVQQRIGLQN